MKCTIEHKNSILFLDTRDIPDSEIQATVETKLKEILKMMKNKSSLDADDAFNQCAKP
jgi:predicted nuclease of predicted toxin-antitoxin system